ncbi:unnamed protein product [Blepharisma stoltei]|uniref:Uncharacterized protein n=1 Tax=Blepharisma stoltei TaxID=1481888 RepID=A0AAU9JTL3_9CILI|nr:unnamed protein product [Blepharisma stoltei]
MDEIFYAIEFFFIILGFLLWRLTNTWRLENGKVFILLFYLILSNFIYYLVHSELIFKIAYATPENLNDSGHFFICLYGHMLWLLPLFWVLEGIVMALNVLVSFCMFIFIDYAGLILVETIAASYCGAWYAAFVIFSPTAIIEFALLDKSPYIFFKDGDDCNDVGFVIALLFYLWPVLTFLFLVYHLIFNTWWALDVSIALAIFVFSLIYLGYSNLFEQLGGLLVTLINIKGLFIFIYLGYSKLFEELGRLLGILINIEELKKNRFIRLALLGFSIWAIYSLFTKILHERLGKIFEQTR